MRIEERLMAARVIEKMQKQASFSKKIGIENVSTYRGKEISENRNARSKAKGEKVPGTT